MAFVTKKRTVFNYQSPVAMYHDNKSANKTIMGLLDYQRDMLEEYMKQYSAKNVAIELPTGSGKTLVGLVIGEFRRRKEHEKVVFLCPTNQLVNQVVEHANSKYGIKAIAFCGKQSEYSDKIRADFLRTEAIAVTTYSSLFVQNTFFSDVDVIIMDDVHSSEGYIIDNWTLNIEKKDDLFFILADYFRKYIGEIEYKRMTGDEEEQQTDSWCNIVPSALLSSDLNTLESIIDSNMRNTNYSNIFSWKRIRENLKECNIYIEKGRIQIRPWVAPTMTHAPFAGAKQRILMSATLGNSGELERVTGISRIKKLPIVNEWDKKGVGRKFFIIPRLSLGKDSEVNVLLALHEIAGRSVVLTPNDRVGSNVKEIVKNSSSKTTIFTAKDIEENKNAFIDNENAMVVLANRFDGIDFPDDESRLLIVIALPRVTNIQEKFLVSRMGGTILYSERIRTRIVQAVGRCTRNTRDYSIVCILGSTIIKDLIEPNKLERYSPELRAEIEFGIENSSEYKDIQEVEDQVKSFFENDKDWQGAEECIVEKRNDFSVRGYKDRTALEKLDEVSPLEVQFQYSIWKKDYKEAFEKISKIIATLNMQLLNGYRSYWNYIGGTLAYYLVEEGNMEYKSIGLKMFQEVLKDNISVKWITTLEQKLFDVKEIEIEDDYVGEILPQLEVILQEYPTKNKLEKQISKILHNLTDTSDKNGQKFEQGHLELGEILGYISKNINTDGAPDPYWIIGDMCIVSEDKIYKSEKEIPICDAREASTHKKWMEQNESLITKKTHIYTVLISNSKKLDSDAKHIVDDIYYLNYTEFMEWAKKALTTIRSIHSTFVEEGNCEWRQAAYRELKQNGVTPLDFFKLMSKTLLKDICE